MAINVKLINKSVFALAFSTTMTSGMNVFGRPKHTISHQNCVSYFVPYCSTIHQNALMFCGEPMMTILLPILCTKQPNLAMVNVSKMAHLWYVLR